MQLIARKNNSYIGYAALCFSAAVIGVLGAIIGMISLPYVWYAFLSILLLPAVFVPVGIFCLKYVRLPNELIFFDGEIIKLYDGRSFALSEIKDIAYKHASSRYGTYKYGTVKFILKNSEEIKVYPVSEIEEVGKVLSKLVYSKQN